MSLARLLFPQVLDVVMDMSQVDAYSEFTKNQYGSPRAGVASKRRKHCVDLNEEPTKRLAGLIGCSISDESKESRMEVLKHRCDALGKASTYFMPYLLFVSYCRFCCCLPVTLTHILVLSSKLCRVSNNLRKQKCFGSMLAKFALFFSLKALVVWIQHLGVVYVLQQVLCYNVN